MKNNNFISIFLCMFNLSLHSMDLPIHTMNEYVEAFSIASLKHYIIIDDEGLFRDFFPDEAFNVQKDEGGDSNDNFTKYLTNDIPCRLYNEAYLNMYMQVRKNSIAPLEKEVLSAHFALHTLLIDTVISPIIKIVYPFGELGFIADPMSQIRLMMASYVEYLHDLIKQSDTVDDESEKYIKHYALVYGKFLGKCPHWFSDKLSLVFKNNFDRFDSLYLYTNILKHLIKDRSSAKSIQSQISQELLQHGFSVPLKKIVRKLVPKKYRFEVSKGLVHILKDFYRLDPITRQDDLSNIILHGDFAKMLIESRDKFIIRNDSLLFNAKDKGKLSLNKKRLRSLVKKYNRDFKCMKESIN